MWFKNLTSRLKETKFWKNRNTAKPSLGLGRWNIDSCIKAQNQKVDWSNEDHCGTCGEYALIKREAFVKKTNNKTEVVEQRDGTI
jgi:hypothetical protein